MPDIIVDVARDDFTVEQPSEDFEITQPSEFVIDAADDIEISYGDPDDFTVDEINEDITVDLADEYELQQVVEDISIVPDFNEAVLMYDVALGLPGPPGPAGASTSAFQYRVDAQSISPSDPGTGKLRYNNAVQQSSTAFYFDRLTQDGFDITALLQVAQSDDKILIQEKDFAFNNQVWTQTGPTINHPDFFEVPVIFVSSNGAGVFSHNQEITVLVRTKGVQGEQGPPGPPGADSTVPGPPGADGATGPEGPIGPIGPEGDPGPQGIQGVKGDTGNTGAQGIQGVPGVDGDDGAPGAPGLDGDDGFDGWSPAMAIISDGERRVLQIATWVGGEGTPPPSGGYIGSSGIVTDIALATDIRGPAGGGGAGSYTHPNHSGEVTSVGDGAQTITANAVNNTKLADMAANSIKGAVSAGDPQDLTATQVRTIINVSDGANLYIHPNHSGDVTSVADGATVIANNVVTNAKLADMAASTMKGNNAGVTGDPIDLSMANVRDMLGSGRTASNFLRGDATWQTPPDTNTIYTHPNHTGEVTSTGDGATVIAANAVSNVKLSDMLANTIKGVIIAGDPIDLTATQVRTIINVADGANFYVHPNHSGDITSIADGATTIAPNVVTNVKLADVATATMKGRITAATGDPEDLTAAQVRTLINVSDGANNYVHPNHSGDVTSVADGATTIAINVVGNTKLADMGANTIKGAVSAGDPIDLSVAQVRTILGPTGTPGATTYLRGDGQWSVPPDTNTVYTHPNHTGDVTSIADGATTIVVNAVTNLKLADMAANSIKGAVSAGDPIDLTAAQVRTIINVADGATNYVHPNHTGDVTSVGGGATTIAVDVVGNTKLANMPTNTMKGNNTAGTADPLDLTTAQVRTLLNVADGANAYVHPNHSGDVTSTGDGATVIAANSVGNTKLTDMAANTIKGNNTGATVDPIDLTLAQVRDMLGSGRTTTNFLRGDGTWQIPADVVGAVTSVFGRTGVVVSATNDYSFAQLSGSPSNAQLGTGTADATTFLSGDRTWKAVASGGAVTSVFGRTGIVVAATNDYSFSQISGDVANSQLAVMAANTLKGSVAGGDPIDLTATQVRSIINVADGANLYIHPNHSGHVVSTGDGATVIQPGVVSNAMLAGNIAASKLVGTDITLNTSQITAGTMATARLGSGTADTTTFLRGDNTWQVVSAGGGAVDSVFGRTGAVVAAMNDYGFSQISGRATNAQLPTVAANRIKGAVAAGDVTDLISTQVADMLGTGRTTSNFLKGDGTWSIPIDTNLVTSVHGRTGAVVSAASDYAFSQISGQVNGATQIVAQSVQNASLGSMAVSTFKGQYISAAGPPIDLTAGQARVVLNVADGANNYSHPNHSGDVTSVSDGATTIANNVVTLGKMQQFSSQAFVGRFTAGTGNLEAGTAAQARTILNVADGANNYVHPNHTGDVTSVADGALTIGVDKVTNSHLANMASSTFKGNNLGTTGDPIDLTVAQSRTLLGLGNLAYLSTVTRNQIDDNEVTFLKLPDLLESCMIGRAAGVGTGDPGSLNATQIRALLNVANGATNYVHPNHTGDVTSVGDGVLTIGAGKVTNSHLSADMLADTIKGRVGSTGSPQNLTVGQVQTMLGITSGASNLTIANVTNITSATIQNPSLFLQVNNICFVSGQITVQPTANGVCRVDVSLPVASDLSGSQHCNGSGSGSSGATARIYGEITGNQARFDINTGTNLASQIYNFCFMYRIL